VKRRQPDASPVALYNSRTSHEGDQCTFESKRPRSGRQSEPRPSSGPPASTGRTIHDAPYHAGTRRSRGRRAISARFPRQFPASRGWLAAPQHAAVSIQIPLCRSLESLPTARSRNERAQIMWKAEALEYRTRSKLKRRGCRNGLLGASGLEVLRCLLFRFLDCKTGACFPSYKTIAKALSISEGAVADALARAGSDGHPHNHAPSGPQVCDVPCDGRRDSRHAARVEPLWLQPAAPFRRPPATAKWPDTRGYPLGCRLLRQDIQGRWGRLANLPWNQTTAGPKNIRSPNSR
jgi:hypothetical protein